MFNKFAAFRSDREGGLSTTFALSLVPMIAGVAFGLSYAERNNQATKVQAVMDAAALASVSAFQNTGLTSSQQVALASSISNRYLTAATPSVPDLLSASAVSVDASNQAVNISYSSTTQSRFSSLLPVSLPVRVSSHATVSPGSVQTPVCILITNATNAHTFRSADTAKVDIYNCLVQVNTDNWDAVEADQTSYIHIHQNSAANQNCYVGQIHFGDITPPKQPSCTLLPDPYASVSMPAAATASCSNNTNYSITTPTTMTQATYGGTISAVNTDVTFDPSANNGVMTFCNKVQFKGGTAKFLPGTYFFNNGQFIVQAATAATAVTASNAAFVFAGNGPKFNMQAGSLTMTPPASGTFQGFSIYWPVRGNNIDTLTLQNATLTTSGVLYAAGATLALNNATFTHVGSVVADNFQPAGSSVVTITGDTTQQNTAPSAGALFKAAVVQIPRLSQ